jgi:hypothetical protein
LEASSRPLGKGKYRWICLQLLRVLRGIFRDWRVIEAELTNLILAMEYAASFNWRKLWLESDSSSVVLAFKNSNLIPIRLRHCYQKPDLSLKILVFATLHSFNDSNP